MESIDIKKMSNCTFEEVLVAWNKGFEGYHVDVTLTEEKLLTNMVREGKYPNTSYVAFQAGEPIGILLNAIKPINGQTIAWNGGTGIAKNARGHGIGQLLVETALKLYEEKGVNTAYLEAISNNDKAIKLYEKMGYDVIDRLSFLEANELTEDFSYTNEYEIKEYHSSNMEKLPFYDGEVPWQCRFENVEGAMSCVVFKDGKPVSYFLKKTAVNGKGELVATVLYQMGIDHNHAEVNDIISFTLHNIFGPKSLNSNRLAINFPHKNKMVLEYLLSHGFETKLEQVHMKKVMMEKAGS
ncbi:GNAT superfamily N-acetyltransferase [Salirhabdus euzebyi]|uniref:GNAT superfamily N-acetyltransferase n=1 Tax=Salirhabdus euzebyi TaxID=394506 RepID=A0A841Q6R7_9BACI|nr:GNAT family N-acetyltransferase [Salirhabdus euzebyi]MBB6454101.1 GNAT superfamily N-acetyltransferase [Salirhabdus euzebyi]